MKETFEELTPVEADLMRRLNRFALIGFIAFLALTIFFLDRYSPDRSIKFDRIDQHFKYGSIGSDVEYGLPLEILKVLPSVFPEYLPKGAPHDYTAFGFIQEPGHSMPIGFSTRRRIIDLAGLNCAACHAGVYKNDENSQAQILLGMPSNTVDLHGFFDFLFRCAEDERFQPSVILPVIEHNKFFLPIIDREIYRRAIVEMRSGILVRQSQLSTFLTPDHPRFLPGRVDTFNPYKVNQFSDYYKRNIPKEERLGTADFPSIWNQSKREGMNLHWDGNNSSVFERNISAALGAGATPQNVDLDSIKRVHDWTWNLPSPKAPYAGTVNSELVNRGKIVFSQNCAICHEFGSSRVGKVERIEDIGTDRGRLDSYTESFRERQTNYTSAYPWAFKHFVKTDGYANQPLDGIWARAPYLHNGSVPTIADLLNREEERPKTFFIGHGVIDSKKLGFRADVQSAGNRNSTVFDTQLPGNSNMGHSGPRYGTELSKDDKESLVEYLKTL